MCRWRNTQINIADRPKARMYEDVGGDYVVALEPVVIVRFCSPSRGLRSRDNHLRRRTSVRGGSWKLTVIVCAPTINPSPMDVQALSMAAIIPVKKSSLLMNRPEETISTSLDTEISNEAFVAASTSG